MADSRCPGCRADCEAGDLDASAVLTCIHCGYVGMWDVAGGHWRLLRPEEHAELIKNEEYLDSISFGFAFRTWRDRDTAQLCTVIHSQLDSHNTGVSAALVSSLAAEIINAGYHTHPTEDDVRALGLGRHGESL